VFLAGFPPPIKCGSARGPDAAPDGTDVVPRRAAPAAEFDPGRARALAHRRAAARTTRPLLRPGTGRVMRSKAVRREAMLTGPGDRLDIRCVTAARLLRDAAAGGPRDGSIATRPRAAAGGRFAALRDASALDRAAALPRTSVAGHPSWTANVVAALPVPVARRLLDRIDPACARAALAELDPETAARLRAAAPAPPSRLVEALIARRAPPAFPPAPPWAVPPGAPDTVARAAARDPDWPAAPERWGAAEDLAAAAARRATSTEERTRAAQARPDGETARGFARLAFALFDRPDEAWGLAGAWPRPGGLALLAAWDAWPDLGALDPDAVPARERAASRLRERWSSWAG